MSFPTGTLSFGLSACGHKVIAFEPMARNAFLLKESVFLNQLSSDKFTVYNMALGNVNGRACFLASSGNQGDGRFVSGKLTIKSILSPPQTS